MVLCALNLEIKKRTGGEKMSTGKIKGITVEIGGDTRPLNDALKKSEKQIKTTQSELREVNRQLKFDPTNTELLKAKAKPCLQVPSAKPARSLTR